jgi:hypothetical protein
MVSREPGGPGSGWWLYEVLDEDVHRARHPRGDGEPDLLGQLGERGVTVQHRPVDRDVDLDAVGPEPYAWHPTAGQVRPHLTEGARVQVRHPGYGQGGLGNVVSRVPGPACGNCRRVAHWTRGSAGADSWSSWGR